MKIKFMLPFLLLTCCHKTTPLTKTNENSNAPALANWSGELTRMYQIEYLDLKKKLQPQASDDPFTGLGNKYTAELFEDAGYPQIKSTMIWYDAANSRLIIKASENAHASIEKILSVKGNVIEDSR